MRKSYINGLVVIIFSAVLAASCERVETPLEEGMTDELIRVEAQGSDMQTRGLLNSADLKKAGTKVKVYDYLTGFSGTIKDADGNAIAPDDAGGVMYIDDAVTYGADGNWKFSSYDWRWTRTGTHNFYGWLTKDKDGLTPASLVSGWTPAIDAYNKLTVPAITMTPSTSQFDFSYSDVVPVDVKATGFNPEGTIELPLKHLFSALAMTIENAGDDQITLVSATVSGINNTKKASMSYASSPVEPAFSSSSSSNFLANLGSGVELNNGTIRDLYTGDVAGSAHNFILMWPQTASEMAAASVTINYTIAGAYAEDGTTLQVFDLTIPLNKNNDFAEGLKAGYKYALNLKFAGKTIDLKLTILPWDYNEYSYDYSESSIDSGPDGKGEMDFNQVYAGYNRAARTVTLQNQSDVITGEFQIFAPHTGRWALTPWSDDGALDYFTVSPTEGEIGFDLTVGKQVVEFTVTPSTTAPPSTVTLHFSVAIQLNGEWVDANSEFNRKDWKIVWER